MSNYFLTGASGAVGSAIVPLLLAEPETNIRILLRADSDEHLSQRMDALYKFWELGPESPARARIEAFRGDATLPQFGLDRDRYTLLCTDTHHIIHCAASVHMNKPLAEARKSAVDSTQAILALTRRAATVGSLRKLEFVSTVGVGGKRPGALPEIWIEEPRDFHNTYEQSKAEAEVLIRSAVETEQLPITVHRPSMVIGSSVDGRIIHFQIFYFICEFLSGRRTFGLYPDFGDAQLDVIPVDRVAEAIVAASRDPGTSGQIFHLCSGPAHAPRLEDLKAMVRTSYRAHGLRIPPNITVTRSTFAAFTRAAARLVPDKHRKALATLPIYLDYLADNQGFDNTRFRQRMPASHHNDARAEQLLRTVIVRYLKLRHPV